MFPDEYCTGHQSLESGMRSIELFFPIEARRVVFLKVLDEPIPFLF
jgi:hypothetical protein